MDDVRGDVLRPPHGTIPAAVKASQWKQNKKKTMPKFENYNNYIEDRT